MEDARAAATGAAVAGCTLVLRLSSDLVLLIGLDLRLRRLISIDSRFI